jgi:hypothetical protein
MTAANRRFARHDVEMLVAMVVGMLVLGTAATFALSAAGMSMSELHNDAPALMLFGMAVMMLVEHVVMLPSMLVAMLLRREEHSGGVHGHVQQVAA